MISTTLGKFQATERSRYYPLASFISHKIADRILHLKDPFVVVIMLTEMMLLP